MGGLGLAGCDGLGASRAEPVGLFTSLPILWRESDDIASMIKSDAPKHWAIPVLEARGPIRPLDRLAQVPADVRLIVMAQPRPLAPDENVALDRWVRAGGHLLLFADPMLTADSAYALGDKRRPQEIALLSPILTRWGLRLEFDEDQPEGERQAVVLGESLPINLSGQFVLAAGARPCELLASGLAARCRIGRGSVFAVADAALFETAQDDGAQRSAALARLLDEAGRGD